MFIENFQIVNSQKVQNFLRQSKFFDVRCSSKAMVSFMEYLKKNNLI